MAFHTIEYKQGQGYRYMYTQLIHIQKKERKYIYNKIQFHFVMEDIQTHIFSK